MTHSGPVRWVVPALAAVLLSGAGAAILLTVAGRAPHCPTATTDSGIVVHGRRTPQKEYKDLRGGTIFDAHTARWDGTQRFPIVIWGGRGICISGGTVQGRWPPSTSWEIMHGTTALEVNAPHVTVEDLRVDGYGDSISLVRSSRDFTIRRVHLSDSRDDCIENDWHNGGTVEDSLLDGCYNAFSARGYSGQPHPHDGRGDVWRIVDTLVRLQPMQRPYEDEGLIPGTAGFFKWDEQGPKLSLHGDVFRADQPASVVGLAFPENKLADCSDNVMVWLGKGDYPAKLPSCFTLTRDVSVWRDAVARWKRDYGHPNP